MFIKAGSKLSTLSGKTNRFFNNVLEGKFIDWARQYYEADMPQIVEDLTPFMELNATEKVLQRLGEFDEITNKRHIKASYDFNKVFALQTSTKILVDLLNL